MGGCFFACLYLALYKMQKLTLSYMPQSDYNGTIESENRKKALIT